MRSENKNLLITFIFSFFLTYLLFISILHAEPCRFFLIGDGKLKIKNAKTNKEIEVSILTNTGEINYKAVEEIEKLFDVPENLSPYISIRLLFALDYFSDIVAKDNVILIESGYRSPEYNASLRNKGANVAKTSTHIDGMAVDFRIDGVYGKKLWEIIRSHKCCGVGYYGGQTVHLDVGRPRFWEAATSKVYTNESDYNRKIYLSTEFDRYLKGEKIRLFLSAISDFGFGVKKRVYLLKYDSDEIAQSVDIVYKNDDCIIVDNRQIARSFYIKLPEKIENGKYRIKIDFCNILFEQMPSSVISNVIEVL